MFEFHQAVQKAMVQIQGICQKTLFLQASGLSEQYGAKVFLKMENLQTTGSFKLRGATNAVRTILSQNPQTPVFSASSGNHGLGIAHALKELGGTGVLYVPESISPAKQKKLAAYPIELRLVSSEDCVAAEIEARRAAEKENGIYVSPYNYPEVVSGQGTIAYEMIEQAEAPLDAVFVALGCGGLAGGVAGTLKCYSPQTRVVAGAALHSCPMVESIAQGKIVETPQLPTLSDGTAGSIEPGSITFDICRKNIDETDRLTEGEILLGLKEIRRETGMFMEGSSGLALATYLKQAPRWQGKRVGVIMCGGNVSDSVKQLIEAP